MSEDRHPPRARASRLTQTVVDQAGSPVVAWAAVTVVVAWVTVGVILGFSDGWNALLWTVCSASTFVMVFLIQHTTSRESRAILLKLDELIRVHTEAREEFIGVERQPLHEQDRLEERMNRREN